MVLAILLITGLAYASTPGKSVTPKGVTAVKGETTNQKLSYMLGVWNAEEIKKNGIPFDEIPLIQGSSDSINQKATMTIYRAQSLFQSLMGQYMVSNTLSQQDRTTLSYALGMIGVTSLQTGGYQIESKYYLSGLNAGIQEKVYNGLNGFGEDIQMVKNNPNIVSGSSTSISGSAFLEANSKKTGVVTLPNGLQYKILVVGKGEKATYNSQVTLNYELSTIQGKVLATSFGTNQPMTVSLDQVIKGWRDVIPLMSEGSTWMVYVPSYLGYGNVAVGKYLGANSTLVFKLQIVKVE